MAARNPNTNTDINSVLTYTPKKGWINDPNGLIFVNGVYHLFYQYNPAANFPQNICWGHAVSSDLVDWRDEGVAIPYNERDKESVFSGNAVIDKANSSRLGLSSNPIVAFWTGFFNDTVLLPDGWSSPNATQAQNMAYSRDGGQTWLKYDGNPIIRQPPDNYTDEFWSFRDPFVFWYQPHGKWVMTLVLSNLRKAVWYSSKNLIDWTYTGQFEWKHSPQGEWECPALVEFKVRNTSERKWVLILSTNPGGRAGGSGMHYHIGHFDGFTFHKDDYQKSTIDWFDYGADCYAGVMWGNLPDNRMIMSVWNNNWDYGPRMGSTYKGGISSRELTLVKMNEEYKLLQSPIWQLSKYVRKEYTLTNVQLKLGMIMIRNKAYKINLVIKGADKSDFSFLIEDGVKNVIARIYYTYRHNVFCIERVSPDSAKAGERENHCIDLTVGSELKMEILIDNYVLTVFLQEGEYVFTEILLSYSGKRKLRLPGIYPKIKAKAVQVVLSKN